MFDYYTPEGKRSSERDSGITALQRKPLIQLPVRRLRNHVRATAWEVVTSIKRQQEAFKKHLKS
jgi:uncharacterized protein YdhG (YjbR/CyaY superfamily)